MNTAHIQSLLDSFLKSPDNGLSATDYEVQTLTIDKDNNILVEVDHLGVVDVDDCAGINRYLVEQLGDEDYSLEVGSVSLSDPFKSKIQYNKHLGHSVIVTDKEGRKYKGQLVSVDEDTFMIDTKDDTETFRYDEVSTKYNF